MRAGYVLYRALVIIMYSCTLSLHTALFKRGNLHVMVILSVIHG